VKTEGKKASSVNPVISIIMPALNEESGISKTISEIPLDILPPTEILVVDGFSTDKTREYAEKMGAKILMEKKKGYGRAIRTGMKEAKGEIMVWIDADFTYPAISIPKIVKPLLEKKADVVIGNRLTSLDQGSMVLSHRFGNIFLTLFFDFLFGKKIKDTQCGLRAFSKKAVDKMKFHTNGMPFATETLIEAVKNKLKIDQVDIGYRKRMGNAKLNSLRDGTNILITMLKNKFRRKK